ncbi:4570_t:CDS:2, partial [Gigaspora rosea]
DENEMQESSPAVLRPGSGVGVDLEELPHQGLRGTLDRLPMETLKVLCGGEGLSESGSKKDLVERLSARVASKVVIKIEVFGRKKMGFGEYFEERADAGRGSRKAQEWASPDAQFIAMERSLEKSIQATLEKVVGEIKRSVQGGSWSRPWAFQGSPRSYGSSRPMRPSRENESGGEGGGKNSSGGVD